MADPVKKPDNVKDLPGAAGAAAAKAREEAERKARAEAQAAEKRRLEQIQAERNKAEAERREREHKAIHRHGVWRGRTEGVIVGIPLGVLVVFLAAISLQDRFSQERWSGAREAVSSEYRESVIQPPPSAIAKPQQ